MSIKDAQMDRRDFLRAVGATAAVGSVTAASGDVLHYAVDKQSRRTSDVFRLVLLFESGPGGKFKAVLNALKAAGLEDDRKELLNHPDRFLITRLSGEFSSLTQSHVYELRERPPSWGG